MFSIVANMLVFVHAGEHFEERQDGHVCYVSVLSRELDLLQILFSFELFWVRELPDDQEAVAKVLICRTSVLSNRCMRNLSNLVYESDDILLKHFRTDCKIMNEAEAENSVCLLSGHHRIHVTA